MGPSTLLLASLSTNVCAVCDDPPDGGPRSRLDIRAVDARTDLPTPANPQPADMPSSHDRAVDTRRPLAVRSDTGLSDAAPPDAVGARMNAIAPTWRAWPSRAAGLRTPDGPVLGPAVTVRSPQAGDAFTGSAASRLDCDAPRELVAGACTTGTHLHLDPLGRGQPITQPQGAADVSVSDLDGDGDDDIAVGCSGLGPAYGWSSREEVT